MDSFSDTRWRRDESGQLVMPERQSDYLDWLISDDKFPETEAEWCKLHGVERGTVKKWRQDRRFREMWERRAVEKNVSPDRLQKVIDVLYHAAIGTADVQAAKQFLLHVEKYMPPREIKRDASVAQLTDAEIRAEIEGILASGFGS